MNLMQRTKNVIVTVIMVFSGIFSPLLLNATNVSAAECKDQSSFLTFPTWYRGIYVNEGGDCKIQPKEINDLWRVVVNIIEILIQLVGYIAVGFIIYGGFRYLTSQGNQNAIGSAKQTITHAIIGLGIALAAVAIIHFVFNALGFPI